MNVLGLDTGTLTGCVVMDVDTGDVVLSELLRAPPPPKGKKAADGLQGIARAGFIAGLLVDIVDDYDPALVMIEDYGYGNKFTLVTLVEIGTVLRYFLKQSDIECHLSSPNSLKVFVCGEGKGKAAKDMMRLGTYKRWGFEHDSDDVVDAYGLARMAQIMLLLRENPKMQFPSYQHKQLKNTYPMK